MIKVFKQASAKRTDLIVALCSSPGACSLPTIPYKTSGFFTSLFCESFLFNINLLAVNNEHHSRNTLQIPITLRVKSGLLSDPHGSNN